MTKIFNKKKKKEEILVMSYMYFYTLGCDLFFSFYKH